MGSCISHENQPDGRAELATNLEDQSTKVEVAQLRKIAVMSSSDKITYVQSSEFADYLRLCYVNKKNMWQEIINQVILNDTKTLVKSIQSIQSKIKNLNAFPPNASNPNHTQFISVVHYYSISFESSLNEYLKSPNTLISTLQQTFTVLIKTLQVLYCLADEKLQTEERWWGTGNNHTQLHGELDQCKHLFEEPLKQFATEYLSDLYGSLNLYSAQQTNNAARDISDNQSNKGVGGNVENGSENSTATAAASAGQALNLYLPSLYKTTLDSVMARQ